MQPGGKNTIQLAISIFPSLSIFRTYKSPSAIAARRTALVYSVFRLQSPPISIDHAASVQSQYWTSILTELLHTSSKCLGVDISNLLKLPIYRVKSLTTIALYVKNNTNRIVPQVVRLNIPTWTFCRKLCYAVRLYSVSEHCRGCERLWQGDQLEPEVFKHWEVPYSEQLARSLLNSFSRPFGSASPHSARRPK